MGQFNYVTVRDGFAKQLITQFGQDMTIERHTAGSYDPSTSTGGVAKQSAACKGVVLGFSTRKIDGEAVRRGDRRILISASGLNFEIKPGDKLLIRNKPLEVIDVTAFAPAGVATHFEVQARSA